MKYLVILIIGLSLIVLGMLMSCESQPIIPQKSQMDAIPYKITVVDVNNNVMTYDISEVAFADGLLNISFYEGCGVSYPFENIKTFLIHK